MLESLRVLMWIEKLSPVSHLGRVEHHDIRLHPGQQQSPVQEPKTRGRKSAHLADRLFERDRATVTHVTAEYPGKGTVVAGVRHIHAKRGDPAVGSNHRIRRSQDTLDIFFAASMVNRRAAAPARDVHGD